MKTLTEAIDYVIFLVRDCRCDSGVVRESLGLQGYTAAQIDAAFFTVRNTLLGG